MRSSFGVIKLVGTICCGEVIKVQMNGVNTRYVPISCHKIALVENNFVKVYVSGRKCNARNQFTD